MSRHYVFIKEGEEEKNGGLWELVERWIIKVL